MTYIKRENKSLKRQQAIQVKKQIWLAPWGTTQRNSKVLGGVTSFFWMGISLDGPGMGMRPSQITEAPQINLSMGGFNALVWCVCYTVGLFPGSSVI